jgi:hypothetical protein
MSADRKMIETHLDDLQSELEAGGRKVDRIRASLFETQFKQAAVMGDLVRRLDDLRVSLRQQRETLRTIRAEMHTTRRRSLDRGRSTPSS